MLNCVRINERKWCGWMDRATNIIKSSWQIIFCTKTVYFFHFDLLITYSFVYTVGMFLYLYKLKTFTWILLHIAYVV